MGFRMRIPTVLIPRLASLVLSRLYTANVFEGRSRCLSTSAAQMAKKSVCIIGSGNWGSAIAKIVGTNVQGSDHFEERVSMWMYEEEVNGQKLTDIVNTQHENVKYLPGVILPVNVVATPDLRGAVTGADILVVVMPHQFVAKMCEHLKGTVKPTAVAISLTKGFAITSTGFKLVSEIISEQLDNIPCSVMMGANIASEVAKEHFCESTIGCTSQEMGEKFKLLFQTPYFRCNVVNDVRTVECCGALKNVVAIAAGIVDGLGLGDNCKAAVIRLGLMEMIKFNEVFMSGSEVDRNSTLSIFFESCCVGDLAVTCHAGRNRALGEEIVNTSKSLQELEEDLLHGQSFQGPLVAKEVYEMLQKNGLLDRFPLFVAVHRILSRELAPQELIECLREHPEHMG